MRGEARLRRPNCSAAPGPTVPPVARAASFAGSQRQNGRAVARPSLACPCPCLRGWPPPPCSGAEQALCSAALLDLAPASSAGTRAASQQRAALVVWPYCTCLGMSRRTAVRCAFGAGQQGVRVMCARDTEGSVPGRAGTPVSRLEERGSQATHLGSGSAEPSERGGPEVVRRANLLAAQLLVDHARWVP